MASASDIVTTEIDLDETLCEEDIDNKLEEIEESIRSHSLRQVFMTKPQMKEYREFLNNALPYLESTKQIIASKYLVELEKIWKIVEEFERKWSSEHSSTRESFPSSLLTNQDFVSQQEQHEQEAAMATDGATKFEEATDTQEEQALNDEKRKFEANLDKTIELIREFKINLLKDLAAARHTSQLSCVSTTTSLVADEYKQSPRTKAKNIETVLKIQMEVQNCDKSENKKE